jgi:fructose-1,6-bisphosphatase/sedoheptulose 1,7-bisphosphatase-like protein
MSRAGATDVLVTRTERENDVLSMFGLAAVLFFSATGVTDGDLLHGVRFFGGGARTHSLVMGYQTKQVRFVDTVHMFDRDSPPRVRL